MRHIFKGYILPALILLFVAALIVFAGQLAAQTSWAAGVRATAATQPSEVGPAPTDLPTFLGAIAISLVRLTLLIGFPAIITWNILRRIEQRTSGKR